MLSEDDRESGRDFTTDLTIDWGKVWAFLGLVSFVLFAYVMLRWVFSPYFKPTGTGPDPVAWSQKVWAWVITGVAAAAFAGCVVYLVRQCRRAGQITFDALLFLAWIVLIWQDPGGNYFRLQTLYNSYLVNMGSWAPFIPGWISPNAGRFPEPILLYFFVYPTTGLLVALAGSSAMSWAARRRMPSGVWGVLLVGFAVCALADFLAENAWIHTSLYQDAGVVKGVSIFGGARTQFPLYSPILWGSVWFAGAALRYFRRDDGRSRVEPKVGVNVRGWRVTWTRFLAILGLLSAVYFGYNVAYAELSLYGGTFPKGYPSYMVNGMCGAPPSPPCSSPVTPGRT